MVKKIAYSDSYIPTYTNTNSNISSNTIMFYASTVDFSYYSTDSIGGVFEEEPGLFDPLVDLVNKVVECRYCSTTYVVPEAGKVECPGCGANAREKAIAKV